MRRGERLKLAREQQNMENMGDIQRLNYGAHFIPILGNFVPTEAMFNLMMVLHVPEFDPGHVPWNSCLKDNDGGCLYIEACDILDPNLSFANRTLVQNQTCALLSNFVRQLQATRSTVARELVNRLQSHVRRSGAYRSARDRREVTRSLPADHLPAPGDGYIQTGGPSLGKAHMSTAHTSDSTSAQEDNMVESVLPFIKCNMTTSVMANLGCLSQTARLQASQLDIQAQPARRQARSTPDLVAQRVGELEQGLLFELVAGLEATAAKVKEVGTTLKTMEVPHEGLKTKSTRTKRGLFNFGGKLLGSLFGVVTDDDIGDIKQAVKSLASNQYKLQEHLDTFKQRVVAVANTTNKHLNKMAAMMGRIDYKFSGLVQDLNQGLQTSARFTALASSMILSLLQDINRVQAEVSGFLAGLRQLQRAELSIDLIPDEALRVALSRLDIHVRKEFPAFSVAEMEPDYYYKHAKPAFTWMDGTLIVYLTVPLSSTDTVFRLFRMSSFGVPASFNDTLVTKVNLEHDVFGISQDHSRFLQITAEDFDSCTVSQTIRCQQAYLVHDTYHATCPLALFNNDKEAIDKLCTFTLELAKPTLDLRPLSPGKVLVINAETVSISCPSRALVTRRGCSYCLWEQPCGCGFTAQDSESRRTIPGYYRQP